MIEIRVARDADATAILAIFRQVAAEIPVLVEPESRWSLIRAQVQTCCAAASSWVALGPDGAVAGFLLAEPDRLERFQFENQAIYLAYAGVDRNWRGRGAFNGLIASAQDLGVPLTATVKLANVSNMVERFTRLGFVISVERADEVSVRWMPAE